MIKILVGFSKEDREKFFKQNKITDKTVVFDADKNEILNTFASKSFFDSENDKTFCFFDSVNALLDFDKGESSILDSQDKEMFFIENTLLVSPTKELNKIFKNIEIIKNEKTQAKSRFIQGEASPFNVVDAFFNNKKSVVWMKFLKYLEEGGKAEELPSVLFWQAKSALLAGVENLKSSGLAPFVYQKSGIIFKKIGEDKLKKKIRDLALLVHDVRFAKDKDELMEEFILKNAGI